MRTPRERLKRPCDRRHGCNKTLRRGQRVRRHQLSAFLLRTRALAAARLPKQIMKRRAQKKRPRQQTRASAHANGADPGSARFDEAASTYLSSGCRLAIN